MANPGPSLRLGAYDFASRVGATIVVDGANLPLVVPANGKPRCGCESQSSSAEPGARTARFLAPWPEPKGRQPEQKAPYAELFARTVEHFARSAELPDSAARVICPVCRAFSPLRRAYGSIDRVSYSAVQARGSGRRAGGSVRRVPGPAHGGMCRKQAAKNPTQGGRSSMRRASWAITAGWMRPGQAMAGAGSDAVRGAAREKREDSSRRSSSSPWFLPVTRNSP